MSYIYYDPEDYGLTVVAEVELSEPDYSFDTVVVWRHESGRLYWAHDSGCSCPVPFEDYDSVEALNLLTNASYRELRAAVADCENAIARDNFLRVSRQELRGKAGAKP